MALKIYGKNKPTPHGMVSTIRLCTVNKKWGYLSFNACTIRELGMEKGMRMLFAQDTDTKAWFFAFGDTENMASGSLLHTSRKNGKVVAMRVQHKGVIEKLCEAAKSDTATFNISMHPKREDGREWYRIITTTPYRIV